MTAPLDDSPLALSEAAKRLRNRRALDAYRESGAEPVLEPSHFAPEDGEQVRFQMMPQKVHTTVVYPESVLLQEKQLSFEKGLAWGFVACLALVMVITGALLWRGMHGHG